MTFPKKIATLALGFGLALSGCDVVDGVNDPQNISPEQALTTIEGYDALLVRGYDGLQDADYYGQQFMLVPDALADNIRVPSSTSNRYPGFASNRTRSHLNKWGGHYSTINSMNIIIEGIDDLEDPRATAQQRNRIKGEAYFMRAINYFDLMRTKAYEPGREVSGFNLGVIIRTSPTENLESADFRSRSTNTEVYDLIVSDINQAVSLLDGAPRTTNTPRAFVSVAAAQALRARVQLYLRNWSEAESAAEAALAATTATLVEGDSAALVAAWTAASHPESIFEVQFTVGTDGAVTNSNSSLNSLTDPTRDGFPDAIPTADLVAAHEANDTRLALYDSSSIGTERLQYIRKYTGTTAQDVDRAPVFRVSEMLLILAEARAEQGDSNGAFEALNRLRNARGLDDADDSDGDIVEQVYRERRLELAFEGHRFFDLKRRGLDIPKPQQSFGVIPYTDFRILAPLPTGEITLNPDLVQNPGYAG